MPLLPSSVVAQRCNEVDLYFTTVRLVRPQKRVMITQLKSSVNGDYFRSSSETRTHSKHTVFTS